MVEVIEEVKNIRDFLLPQDIDISKFVNNNPKATG